MPPDSIDQKLLNLVQTAFPLTRTPYADLGLELGIDGDEVIHRIEQLKADGLIRQISPILDARSLGYQSTLVATQVTGTHLEKAAQVITAHPGVSHGYERDHHFNLWFTLAIPPTTSVEAELQQLTGSINAEAIFALPAIKLFKIRVYFAMGEEDQEVQPEANATTLPHYALPPRLTLSPGDRAIINTLQQDLPLTCQPFQAMAEQAGMKLADFLAGCQSLKERGIMRRYAAAINHRRAGFKANAMTCWLAPPDMVDAAGQKLASRREVSHCYERKTNPRWQYNLFSMIHGHTKEACYDLASEMSAETGLKDYILLFSTREFKKTRIKYTV